MGKVIVLANQKGGVGKTTTCINLASFLARKHKKTLVIDMDPQGNTCSGLGISPEKRKEKNIYQVFTGEKVLSDVIYKTDLKYLQVVPVVFDLAGAQNELLDMDERDLIIKKSLEGIKNKYDFILIDTPPSLGLFTVNAMIAADSIIIPLQSEFYALEGLTQLLKSIKMIKNSANPKLNIEGILITMFDYRTNLSKDVLEEVGKFFNNKIYQTIIPRNIRLSEAPSYGKPIHDYDKSSVGAKAYERFGKEFLKRVKKG